MRAMMMMSAAPAASAKHAPKQPAPKQPAMPLQRRAAAAVLRRRAAVVLPLTLPLAAARKARAADGGEDEGEHLGYPSDGYASEEF